MHLIFLPTLKLQGTEGSQGLHRSFPRCLPHLRSAEVKNGCISNTYLEQNVPWHHELHWTMRRKIVNKRHGCYFLVASSLTTLKIGNPETNTEWTPLKINDFQGRAISFRKCEKCWHQEKNNKKRQSFFKSTGLFVASFQNQSWSLPLPGPAQEMAKRTRTLWILLDTLEKNHTNLKIIWFDPQKNACFLVEHLTFCTLPCRKLHLTYIKRRVQSSYKHRSLPNEINCKCKFFPLVMKHFYNLRTLTFNQVEEFCCRE